MSLDLLNLDLVPTYMENHLFRVVDIPPSCTGQQYRAEGDKWGVFKALFTSVLCTEPLSSDSSCFIKDLSIAAFRVRRTGFGTLRKLNLPTLFLLIL